MRSIADESDIVWKKMRRSKTEMYPLMSRYEESGLSKAEFCRQNGLGTAVFWYWYSKYRRGNKKVGFIEVKEIPKTTVKFEVTFRGEKIIFYEYPPARYLNDLFG